MDKLEFLDGAEAPTEDVQVEQAPVAAPAEPAAETPQEPTGERPRGPDGKFVAKETAPAVAATPEAAPTAEPTPPPAIPEGYVPVKVVQELREEIRSLRPQAQPQPVPQIQQAPPDMFEDPDGYNLWSQNQIVNVQLNISEEMTRDKYGDELVDAARDWAMTQFQTKPGFAQEVFSQRNPYTYAVKAYQKHQSVSQLGDDPKEIQAFLAWRAAQTADPAQLAQPAAQPPPQQPATPTRSIASATSAGGVQHQAVGPGVAFDDTIR